MPPGGGHGGPPGGGGFGGPPGGGGFGGLMGRVFSETYLSRRYGGTSSSYVGGDFDVTDNIGPIFNESVRKAQNVAQIRFYQRTGKLKKVKAADGTITREQYKLTDELPIKGKQLRFSSRAKGLFFGIVHFIPEPLVALRNAWAEAHNEVRHKDNLISDEEYNRVKYIVEERKLHRQYKLHYLSEEDYQSRCDELESRLLGATRGRAR